MSNFNEFTKKYPLSKTLRFELKPYGRTLENMKRQIGYDPEIQSFLKDQEIENAYRTLKPVLDRIHERFITESLESESAKAIDIREYLEAYRNKRDANEKEWARLEKDLRNAVGKAFSETSKAWQSRYPELDGSGFKMLMEKGVFEFIEIHKDEFEDICPREKLSHALLTFKGFSTYFIGFNQNRENYYETGKEAKTAVATRIVHENLPKFCDNLLAFESREDEYVWMHSFLHGRGRELVTKEGVSLVPLNVEDFRIQRFSTCLTQREIESYAQVVANANSLVNLYNQAKSQEIGFRRLPLFKALYKQIGCGKKAGFVFGATHEKESEAEEARSRGAYAKSVESIFSDVTKAGGRLFRPSTTGSVDTVPALIEYVLWRSEYSGFYWSKAAITSISSRYFANWHVLKDSLKDAKIFKQAKGDEEIRTPDAVELSSLFEVLDAIPDWKNPGVVFKTSLTEISKEAWIDAGSENAIRARRRDLIDKSEIPSKALLRLIFADVERLIEEFFRLEPLAKSALLSPEIIGWNSDSRKTLIKEWLDTALTISQILRYFSVRETKAKGAPIDSVLSFALDSVLLNGSDGTWYSWYDDVRNFLTRKPQDAAKENKLKLNFENGTLAAGWDLNKESENYCVILRDGAWRKYLAVMARRKDSNGKDVRGCNKIFSNDGSNPLFFDDGCGWEKMEYKLLPGPNKMLPKCLMPRKDRKKYGATDFILRIYDDGGFKKSSPNFNRADLATVIDFYKSAIPKYENWECFWFQFKPTEEYSDISEFYHDVESQGYRLDFRKISKTRLDELVDDGSCYLFEIRNQDSNSGKAAWHTDNLHTIYWNAVFESVANRPKLNGEAEIFYRAPVAEEKLGKKKDAAGREVIQNYRFSKEKFIFHVPITLNFCVQGSDLNAVVREHVASNYSDVRIIGIDRGEKHLAYYSIINLEGNIIEQGSLNEIAGHDYGKKLESRAEARDEARKNWSEIGTIKELKEGYVSQAVRKIADLAIEHHALVVLEDLNTGFKRSRQKIEKSVYQKFELALAKKLNYLTDKSKALGDPGSATNAFQLTPPVSNYGDIEGRKQVGIMLYTRANYTSQTDPATGWRKTVYLKKGSEQTIKDQIFDTFSDIAFDGKDYVFEYLDGQGKTWALYSGVNGIPLPRFRGERWGAGEWRIVPIDVHALLDAIFVNFDKSRSLLSQMEEWIPLEKTDANRTSWESLRFAIDSIMQIRNTGLTDRDSDFLFSPVRDSKGRHFDSREWLDLNNGKQAGNALEMPLSWDANGAFNIARKGRIMLEHLFRDVKYSSKEMKDWNPLYVSDYEWDAYLRWPESWEKWISNNLVKKEE